jgi:hypothetical protein
MSHATSTQGNQVDFSLFVVGSQTGITYVLNVQMAHAKPF